MKPATVAIVTDSPSFAGAERYLAVLVSTLAERRFVALLPDPADPEVASELSAAGAEIVEVAGLSRRPSLQGTRNARRALRAIGPGLVHVNATDDRDLGPLVACLGSRIPALATVHLVLPRRARWRALLSRAVLARLGCVIAVSQASAADMRRLGIKARVVRNGLPAPRLAAGARARLGLDPGAFVVGGIGRLDEQKGWDVLCAAAPEIVAGCPRAQFLVIGDGAQREALRRLPGAEHVRFAGALPGASTLLGAFDVLAMPSRYEGLPLVAIEAMLAGVPIVATAAGGVAEAVGDAGTLVAVDDAPALARALLALAHDPDARGRLADAGRRRAQEHFSARRMAEETAAIYAQLEVRR
jgi:glycosyltransferase involved in cell wall biosynthesis